MQDIIINLLIESHWQIKKLRRTNKILLLVTIMILLINLLLMILMML